ncbi:hypothetical protein KBY97_05960 [Synechococcus sp. ATX 2A4]|uniref:hypothetical protein n=1 Tax=Synechococcus sp. ATX 2A4 TaxID=2823727 RepID=UPI0020CCE8D0|nr:hypothetical protein [Synechococcus sp. ATX 2A4]MCP9884670.1 hypothetical protein [Synechococcus sp. ATX 2A4]
MAEVRLPETFSKSKGVCITRGEPAEGLKAPAEVPVEVKRFWVEDFPVAEDLLI